MDSRHLAAEKGNCCALLMNAIYWRAETPPSSFYSKRKLVSLAEVCLSISAPAHRGQDLQPYSGGARRHTDEGQPIPASCVLVVQREIQCMTMNKPNTNPRDTPPADWNVMTHLLVLDIFSFWILAESSHKNILCITIYIDFDPVITYTPTYFVKSRRFKPIPAYNGQQISQDSNVRWHILW